MNAEKRVLKGYKVKDSVYQRAKKRATREGGSLANVIECVVIAYAGGFQIKAELIKDDSKPKYITLDEVVATYLLSKKK